SPLSPWHLPPHPALAIISLISSIPRSICLRDVTRYLTGPHFKPLHGIAIDKVSRKDVASRLVVIAREHSDVVAAKARDTLSGFFVWAMQNGIAESNPVVGTRRPQGNKPRDRVLAVCRLMISSIFGVRRTSQ